jgi:hypothetical protein
MASGVSRQYSVNPDVYAMLVDRSGPSPGLFERYNEDADYRENDWSENCNFVKMSELVASPTFLTRESLKVWNRQQLLPGTRCVVMT